MTISGSLPLGVRDDTYAQWIEALVPVVQGVLVDTSSKALQQSLRAKPTAIVPNAEEYAAIRGDEDRALTHIVVTEGAKGVTWYGRAGERRSWTPPAVKVRNTVGAGDVFLGGLVTQLEQGIEWGRAIPWAMAAATASVETLGVADVELSRINTIYHLIIK